MADLFQDQATGLRRMFSASATPVIALFSGAEAVTDGRSGLLVRTAATLAAKGRRSVIIDEHSVRGGFSVALGYDRQDAVFPSRDLFDVLLGDCTLEQVMHSAAPRFQVIPAARLARSLGATEPLARQLICCLTEIRTRNDFVLIDAAPRRGVFSPLVAAASIHVVVTTVSGDGIKESYGTIKRLVQEYGWNQLAIVVSRARDEVEAQSVFANLRTTARKHLGVSLTYLGAVVRSTENLAQALQQLTKITTGTGKPLAEKGTADRLSDVMATRPAPASATADMELVW